MAQKIKFNIIQSLFRLFSFLADKTGGWIVFVKPKILLGTIILGLFCAGIAVTSCSPEEPTCYDVAICYLPPPPPPESSDTSTTE